MFRSIIILLFCCSSLSSIAQLCQGSLGDPVVYISFGAGPNPGPALPTNVTNYSFVSTACPNDGQYTIANSSAGCFNDTWHTVTADHTPNDQNGYMMIVNAAQTPGDFYVAAVNGLCGGTTYEFAAWVMNMLKPSSCNGAGLRPNVTFRIETTSGNVIASFNTGDIAPTPSAIWTQQGFFFQTPAGTTSVVIRMTNNGPGGCGNDLAIDDITFRPCSPRVSAEIQGQPGIKTLNVCYANAGSYILQATANAGAGTAFQWQRSFNGIDWQDVPNGTLNNITVSFTQKGSYYFRVANASPGNITQTSCRTYSEMIQFNIIDAPTISLSDTAHVCEGSDVSITITGAADTDWTLPNGSKSTANPLLIPGIQSVNAGKYLLTASSAEGCTAKDSVQLVVHAIPFVNAGSDITACTGTRSTLNGQASANVVWSPSTGLSDTTILTPSVNINTTTIYTLTAKDAYGCTATDQVTVTMLVSPTANAGPDKEIFEGNTVELNGSASGNDIQYQWSPSSGMTNSNTLSPSVAPTQDTYYRLTVTAANGCPAAFDDVFVKVYKKLVIPNSFSPNGDGINDQWIIPGLNTYSSNSVQVYSRYGVKVFESFDNRKTWDGTYNGSVLEGGVYYYVIDTKRSNGKFTGWLLIVK